MTKANVAAEEAVANGTERTEQNSAVNVPETEEVVETGKKWLVTRGTPFMSKGKKCYPYELKAKVRGKDVVVRIVPPKSESDKKGFGIIDLVFGDSNTAEFITKESSFTDNGGVKKKVNTYYVRNVDIDADTGEVTGVYECPVVPERTSDKSLLAIVLANGIQ